MLITFLRHEIDLELAERRFKELREAREARHKKREENLERIDPNYAKRKEERAKKSHRVEKFRSMVNLSPLNVFYLLVI